MKTIVITRKMEITFDASGLSRHEFESDEITAQAPTGYDLISKEPQITVTDSNQMYASYVFRKKVPNPKSGLGAAVKITLP